MLVRIVVFALALSAAQAQSPETPPDAKAYTAASRTMDPQQKIDALEKWKKDFPDSEMQDSADQLILSTLVKHFPQQQDRIRELAAGIYRTAPEKNRGSVANQIAGHLLDGNLLLKDAEHYARLGVDSMRLAPYLRDQMAAAEKRKQKPKPEELQKRFLETRAARLATLGRIEVQLGQTATGRNCSRKRTPAIPPTPRRTPRSANWPPKPGRMPKHSNT